MKKSVYILLFFVPIVVFSQSINQNYVKNTTYKIESSTSLPTSPPPEQANVEVTYFDGIGRPIQQIAHKQSASGKDVITPIEYDYYGRQAKEYLPFSSQQTDMSYFSDIENLKNELQNYHQDVPFGEKLFEKSPLNRVLKQGFPGTDWQITNNSNDHTIKFDYQTNSKVQVKLFKVTISSTTDGVYNTSLVQDGYYMPNQLYKTIITDENGSTTDEFKDSEGRIILKRMYNTIPINGAKEVLDTYYVYDRYGNLTYVIPPKASDLITISNNVLDNLCYQYRYDYRNRLVEKKLPGKTTEYIVYDKLDRIVATGPVLAPFQIHLGRGWLVTKYDVLGRIAYTGWDSTDSSIPFSTSIRNTFQTQVNAGNLYVTRGKQTIKDVEIGYLNNGTYPEITNLLTVNYYDNYNYPYSPTQLPTTIEQQAVTDKTKGLLTGSWVRVLTTQHEKLFEMTHTFYDKKARPIRTDFRNHLGGYTQTDTKLDFIGNPQYTIIKHKLTDSDNEITVREDFEYTPQGRLLSHKHKINNGHTETLSHNQYDELGQLIVQKTGRNANNPLQTVDYKYNIRGWLTDINDVDNLGNDLFAFKIKYNNPSFLEGITAQYNGNISETYWRTSSDNILRKYSYTYDAMNRMSWGYYFKPLSSDINNNYTMMSYDVFVGYDKNGNITKLWRFGDLDSELEVINIDNIEYTYDQGNRLIKADDHSNHPAGFNDGVDIDIEYTYDIFGNVIWDKNKDTYSYYNHLNLPDVILKNSVMNMITYTYNALGQKRRKEVKQIVGSTTTTTTTDYQGIFHYQNDKLSFLVTAQGYVNKQEAIPLEVNPNPVIPLSENSQNSSSLSFFNYVYNYTDHLGNVRLSYTEFFKFCSLRILEENHYYPFGLKHQKYGATDKDFVIVDDETGEGYYVGIENVPPKQRKTYQYKFQGQEYQNEFDLNVYDFGARNYDPALGRWLTIDPLAEQSRRWSPYNFAYNNPIYFIDPDGMSAFGFDELDIPELDLDDLDVMKNSDGTYTVVGGQANSDRNIYVVGNDGKRTGEVVGQMLTDYSFHDNNGDAVLGAKINPNDQSGQNFFNNEIQSVGLFEYMGNAKGNEKYDFKTRGIDTKGEMSNEQYHYRGMPFEDKIASARDIGNYGAGFVAGKNVIPWFASRLAFDALESHQSIQRKGGLKTEGQPSQQAQRAGHNAGYQSYLDLVRRIGVENAKRIVPFGPK